MYSLTPYYPRPPFPLLSVLLQCPTAHTDNYRLCFARPKRQLGPRLLVLLQSEALPQRGLPGEQALVKGRREGSGRSRGTVVQRRVNKAR